MKKVFQVFYKMRYYFLVIFICGVILSVIDSFLLFDIYGLDWYFTTLFVFLSIIAVITIDGLTALVVHHLPKKWMEPSRFKEHKWEKGFFKFIKIRNWKDKIPEIGAITADFAKDKMENTSSCEYLYQFLIEIGYAEVIHFASFVTGFLIIFILPFKYFIFIGLWVGIINIIFNLLSGLIQRYNRPKLLVVYNRAKKNEEKNNQ